MRSPTRCPGSTATFPPTRTFRRRRSAVQPSDDAWNLLNRLAKVYISPDAEFPAPKGPGYIVRYSVERIGGVGPWHRARAEQRTFDSETLGADP